MNDTRMDVLSAPQRLGLTVVETCRRYGISRDTFYTWQRRYNAEGVAGLNERRRGPRQSPTRTNQAIEDQIVALRRQHPNWGAHKLRTELALRGMTDLPATSTVHAILQRSGLIRDRGRQPPTRPRRGAATRQALIDAAIELWSSTGWRGTGITAVAERVGVTDAGLLHHFPTKQDFLLQVLAELDRRELARFESWGPPTGLDLIRQLPDMARASLEHPGLWKLHLMLQAENLDPDGPAYEYYLLRHHFIHQGIADAIRTGQEQGEIRADADPDLIAAQVLAFLMGHGLNGVHGPKQVDVIAVCEDFANRLIRDLTAH